jgi:hypothetical protein
MPFPMCMLQLQSSGCKARHIDPKTFSRPGASSHSMLQNAGIFAFCISVSREREAIYENKHAMHGLHLELCGVSTPDVACRNTLEVTCKNWRGVSTQQAEHHVVNTVLHWGHSTLPSFCRAKEQSTSYAFLGKVCLTMAVEDPDKGSSTCSSM